MAEEQLRFDIFNEYEKIYSLGYKPGDEVKTVEPMVMGKFTPDYWINERSEYLEAFQWEVIEYSAKIYGDYYNAKIKREK